MKRSAIDQVGTRLRVEVAGEEAVQLVDLDLGERTSTLTLAAAVELGERLGEVLLMARRFDAAEASRAGLTVD